MRQVTLILAGLLVGYPVVIAPSSAVLFLGIVAVLFCALGLS
jgi:hypothetical protein